MKKISLVVLLTVYMINPTFAANSSPEKDKAFIRSLYTGFVLNDKLDFEGVASQMATKKVLNRFQKEYGLEYSDCVVRKGNYSQCGYAVWELRTGGNGDKGPDSISKVNSITSLGNGWYKVSYTDMGFKGITNVKIINDHGTLKVDDYKRVYAEQ
jgi:hypothetical protein